MYMKYYKMNQLSSQLCPHNPFIDVKERITIVGNHLHYFHKRAGLQQKELFKIIGCKPQTYSGYETGKHEPSIETLVRLANLYEISLDYLVGRYEGTEAENDPINELENDIENRKFDEINVEMQLLRN